MKLWSFFSVCAGKKIWGFQALNKIKLQQLLTGDWSNSLILTVLVSYRSHKSTRSCMLLFVQKCFIKSIMCTICDNNFFFAFSKTKIFSLNIFSRKKKNVSVINLLFLWNLLVKSVVWLEKDIHYMMVLLLLHYHLEWVGMFSLKCVSIFLSDSCSTNVCSLTSKCLKLSVKRSIEHHWCFRF